MGLIILAIVVVLVLTMQFRNINEGKKVIILEQDDSNMLNINFYDKNDNQINPQETFSIINYSGTGYREVPGVSFIDFSIALSNAGSKDLTCNIINATPTSFYNSLPQTTLQLIYGRTDNSAWTSSKLNTSLLESPNVTRFNVTVKCTSSSGDLIKSSHIDILIKSDLPKKVKFRTSNLDYTKSTSAFGYAENCGNTLSRYGKVSSSGWLVGTCDSFMPTYSQCGYPIKVLSGLPFNPANTPLIKSASLWISSNVTLACICQESISGEYAVNRFQKNYGGYNTVNNSSIPINSTVEVYCNY
jgi:hypothetical protein